MKFDFSVLQNNKLLKAKNKLHGSESLLRGQSSLSWSRNFLTSTDSEDMFRLHNSTAGHILASWIQSIHYFRVCRAVPLPPCRRQGGGGDIAPTHYWPRHYTRVSVSVTPRPRFAPGNSVSIVQEAGWATELVWTQRIEEKHVAYDEDQTPVFQSLHWLSYPGSYCTVLILSSNMWLNLPHDLISLGSSSVCMHSSSPLQTLSISPM
jgi:hypothetical protein